PLAQLSSGQIELFRIRQLDAAGQRLESDLSGTRFRIDEGAHWALAGPSYQSPAAHESRQDIAIGTTVALVVWLRGNRRQKRRFPPEMGRKLVVKGCGGQIAFSAAAVLGETPMGVSRQPLGDEGRNNSIDITGGVADHERCSRSI